MLPVIHAGQVLGVFEIAAFQPFKEREIQLMDALMPILAVALEIMARNQRTRDLLAATREQAERMEKQAAQLEEQTVEMEAQQAELRETEDWFRSIIESAADGMLVADAAGRILLANPAAERLLGAPAGALLGQDLKARLAGSALHWSEHALPARGNRSDCVSVSLRAAA